MGKQRKSSELYRLHNTFFQTLKLPIHKGNLMDILLNFLNSKNQIRYANHAFYTPIIQTTLFSKTNCNKSNPKEAAKTHKINNFEKSQ